MRSFKKALLFGFLVWLVPFVAAFFIFPLKTSIPALFETIVHVVLTSSIVLFSVFYFKGVEAGFAKEGVRLGVIWFAVALGIDLALFVFGPFKMSFGNYMTDIGLAYLAIPAVTIGFGCILARKLERSPIG